MGRNRGACIIPVAGRCVLFFFFFPISFRSRSQGAASVHAYRDAQARRRSAQQLRVRSAGPPAPISVPSMRRETRPDHPRPSEATCPPLRATEGYGGLRGPLRAR
ncbi:hypothetical protein EDB81DRAFT_181528 [Dactylonectria macrodidyma]|uniref:Uncharacterized protein n=1 Tax=Dactylonectria macrodidyma TaxID=307937 RepID=A0A9P9FPT7_9HYPO|nr:hypothetical protein EDB81DRAFT_181528 [Dactylonectria macrodidyma]